MGTPSIEFDKTLRSKKFMSLLIAALLVTYALPFPLVSGFMESYGMVKEILRLMEKENDAINCHAVFNFDPDFFGGHGMKCDETYYRPNETTVSCCGMQVYRDTYWEYLRASSEMREKLPLMVVFAVWVFLTNLTFSYALVDAAVGLTGDGEKRIIESIKAGLKALPALVAAEILTFVVVLIALVLLAIPIAIFGPFGSFIAGILTTPAFALVVPAYYFTGDVGVVGEIWRVARTNPGGYFTMGLGLSIVDVFLVLQYEYYMGALTLLLLLFLGAVRYVINSPGALWVYVETIPEEEIEGEI
ncbi:transmembrane efflux pump [Thermococcus sp. 4557]|uniref:hypothetical protein n=1 Tax=Thermococcus sp. (strain CGMCC 1.5172 / 4557) TaxID=1042877 RepID=UPI000219E840|nr:hypothetical protein [Thermococcus sp. 4557]AEK72596.1 transmembrane efflux pump [Thermococcus sp. 4557]